MLNLMLAMLVAGEGRLAFGGDAYLVEEHPAVAARLPLVVNFEGAVCADAAAPAALEARAGQPRQWRLCVGAEAGRFLARAGVVAALLENNHAADGDARATLAHLKAAAVAAVTATHPWCSQGLCVVAWHDARGAPPAAVLDLVRTLGSSAKVVAVVHQSLQGSDPRPLLLRFADAGARVVLAVGSHRLGPVEWRKGAVLFHGLGDYAFDCACSSGTRGLIVEVGAQPAELPTARLVRTARGRGARLGEGVPDEGELLQLARASAALGARVAVVDGTLTVLGPIEPAEPR